MLHVKTVIKESTIPGAGKGLFAEEKIHKGTIVWTFNEAIDSCLSQAQVDTLGSEERKKFILHAFHSNKTDLWITCSDGAQYVNHSETPNLAQIEVTGNAEFADIANRDILPGEELFDNYLEYDFDAKRKLT